MNWETIKYRTEDGLGYVSLNRPHRLNAMTRQLMRELHDALQEAARDPKVRAILLFGEGRAFCAGDDLKETASGHGGLVEVRAFVTEIQQVTRDLKSLRKPTIAAVHGYALGGGCELALGCDLIVAATDAQFGFPETSVGLLVTGGATYLLPRIVGLQKAKELLMTGDYVSGLEAEQLGLVNRAVDAGEVLASAEALARKITQKAPLAIELTKIGLELGAHADLQTAMAFETESTVLCFLTEDAKEGARAFVEGRAPRYTGR